MQIEVMRSIILALTFTLILSAGSPAPTAHAQDSGADAPQAFRVCQDPNNLPFSNTHGEGFENRIAHLFADQLGWQLEYFPFPQRMGFIRNTLRFKLPGENYRCDVVMGVPAQFDQAAPTQPYYRSAYTLVVPSGRGLDAVKSIEDFLALPREQLERLRIGVYDRSPASSWLALHGLVDQGVPYRILSADPEFYPGEIVEKDLVDGKIDVAVVWGPIGGFFVKRRPEAGLRLIPLASEPGVRLDFPIAMGVRHSDRELKATLDRLITRNQTRIDAILREYGVPLVDSDGKVRN
jgi:quinoprotein dehydrogenase-associated probable ABC transporter substrate-binding protein